MNTRLKTETLRYTLRSLLGRHAPWVAAMAVPGLAAGGPTGEDVVRGAADVGRPDTSTTVIDQFTEQVAINWQSFSVDGQEYVIFNQPSSSSIALNRVVGGAPSVILGTIQANGQVFLVNGRGITFGEGAVIDAQGFVASTLDISDDDFMAGDFSFAKSSGAPDAEVRNYGTIQAAADGYVVLAGDYVENSGIIVANAGHVILGAGSAITLDIAGDGLTSFVVDEATLAGLAGVRNVGQILANGSMVIMTAEVANSLVATAVNQEGLIQAHSVEEHQGVIYLAAEGGDIEMSGRLVADGVDGADGGAVVLRSGGDLDFTGSISAAGDEGAEGGFVELSADGGLAIRGAVDTGGGHLLIDPATLTLQSGSGAPGSSVGAASVGVGFVEGQLNAGTDVSLIASSSINASPGVSAITATTGTADLFFGIGSTGEGTTGDLNCSFGFCAPGSTDQFVPFNFGAINLPGVTITVGGDLDFSASYGFLNVGSLTAGGNIGINAGGAVIGFASSFSEGNTITFGSAFGSSMSASGFQYGFFFDGAAINAGGSLNANITSFGSSDFEGIFASGPISAGGNVSITAGNPAYGAGVFVFDQVQETSFFGATAGSMSVWRESETSTGAPISAGGNITISANGASSAEIVTGQLSAPSGGINVTANASAFGTADAGVVLLNTASFEETFWGGISASPSYGSGGGTESFAGATAGSGAAFSATASASNAFAEVLTGAIGAGGPVSLSAQAHGAEVLAVSTLTENFQFSPFGGSQSVTQTGAGLQGSAVSVTATASGFGEGEALIITGQLTASNAINVSAITSSGSARIAIVDSLTEFGGSSPGGNGDGAGVNGGSVNITASGSNDAIVMTGGLTASSGNVTVTANAFSGNAFIGVADGFNFGSSEGFSFSGAGADVSAFAGGNANISANGAWGANIVTGAVSASSGDVTLGASASGSSVDVLTGDLTAGGTVAVSAWAGSSGWAEVTVGAVSAGSGANLTATGSSSASVTAGNIFTSTGNVTVNANGWNADINVGNVTASTGSVGLDAQGRSDATLTAGNVTAGAGITLDASASSSGSGRVTAGDLFAGSGNITVDAFGWSAATLNVGAVSAASGAVTLGVFGTSGFADLDAGTVTAGGNVTITANGSSGHASVGAVSQTGASGSIDISAPSGVVVNGGITNAGLGSSDHINVSGGWGGIMIGGAVTAGSTGGGSPAGGDINLFANDGGIILGTTSSGTGFFNFTGGAITAHAGDVQIVANGSNSSLEITVATGPIIADGDVGIFVSNSYGDAIVGVLDTFSSTSTFSAGITTINEASDGGAITAGGNITISVFAGGFSNEAEFFGGPLSAGSNINITASGSGSYGGGFIALLAGGTFFESTSEGSVLDESSSITGADAVAGGSIILNANGAFTEVLTGGLSAGSNLTVNASSYQLAGPFLRGGTGLNLNVGNLSFAGGSLLVSNGGVGSYGAIDWGWDIGSSEGRNDGNVTFIGTGVRLYSDVYLGTDGEGGNADLRVDAGTGTAWIGPTSSDVVIDVAGSVSFSGYGVELLAASPNKSLSITADDGLNGTASASTQDDIRINAADHVVIEGGNAYGGDATVSLFAGDDLVVASSGWGINIAGGSAWANASSAEGPGATVNADAGVYLIANDAISLDGSGGIGIYGGVGAATVFGNSPGQVNSATALAGVMISAGGSIDVLSSGSEGGINIAGSSEGGSARAFASGQGSNTALYDGGVTIRTPGDVVITSLRDINFEGGDYAHAQASGSAAQATADRSVTVDAGGDISLTANSSSGTVRMSGGSGNASYGASAYEGGVATVGTGVDVLAGGSLFVTAGGEFNASGGWNNHAVASDSASATNNASVVVDAGNAASFQLGGQFYMAGASGHARAYDSAEAEVDTSVSVTAGSGGIFISADDYYASAGWSAGASASGSASAMVDASGRLETPGDITMVLGSGFSMYAASGDAHANPVLGSAGGNATATVDVSNAVIAGGSLNVSMGESFYVSGGSAADAFAYGNGVAMVDATKLVTAENGIFISGSGFYMSPAWGGTAEATGSASAIVDADGLLQTPGNITITAGSSASSGFFIIYGGSGDAQASDNANAEFHAGNTIDAGGSLSIEVFSGHFSAAAGSWGDAQAYGAGATATQTADTVLTAGGDIFIKAESVSFAAWGGQDYAYASDGGVAIVDSDLTVQTSGNLTVIASSDYIGLSHGGPGSASYGAVVWGSGTASIDHSVNLSASGDILLSAGTDIGGWSNGGARAAANSGGTAIHDISMNITAGGLLTMAAAEGVVSFSAASNIDAFASGSGSAMVDGSVNFSAGSGGIFASGSYFKGSAGWGASASAQDSATATATAGVHYLTPGGIDLQFSGGMDIYAASGYAYAPANSYGTATGVAYVDVSTTLSAGSAGIVVHHDENLDFSGGWAASASAADSGSATVDAFTMLTTPGDITITGGGDTWLSAASGDATAYDNATATVDTGVRVLAGGDISMTDSVGFDLTAGDNSVSAYGNGAVATGLSGVTISAGGDIFMSGGSEFNAWADNANFAYASDGGVAIADSPILITAGGSLSIINASGSLSIEVSSGGNASVFGSGTATAIHGIDISAAGDILMSAGTFVGFYGADSNTAVADGTGTALYDAGISVQAGGDLDIFAGSGIGASGGWNVQADAADSASATVDGSVHLGAGGALNIITGSSSVASFYMAGASADAYAEGAGVALADAGVTLSAGSGGIFISAADYYTSAGWAATADAEGSGSATAIGATRLETPGDVTINVFSSYGDFGMSAASGYAYADTNGTATVDVSNTIAAGGNLTIDVAAGSFFIYGVAWGDAIAYGGGAEATVHGAGSLAASGDIFITASDVFAGAWLDGTVAAGSGGFASSDGAARIVAGGDLSVVASVGGIDLIGASYGGLASASGGGSAILQGGVDVAAGGDLLLSASSLLMDAGPAAFGANGWSDGAAIAADSGSALRDTSVTASAGGTATVMVTGDVSLAGADNLLAVGGAGFGATASEGGVGIATNLGDARISGSSVVIDAGGLLTLEGGVVTSSALSYGDAGAQAFGTGSATAHTSATAGISGATVTITAGDVLMSGPPVGTGTGSPSPLIAPSVSDHPGFAASSGNNTATASNGVSISGGTVDVTATGSITLTGLTASSTTYVFGSASTLGGLNVSAPAMITGSNVKLLAGSTLDANEGTISGSSTVDLGASGSLVLGAVTTGSLLTVRTDDLVAGSLFSFSANSGATVQFTGIGTSDAVGFDGTSAGTTADINYVLADLDLFTGVDYLVGGATNTGGVLVADGGSFDAGARPITIRSGTSVAGSNAISGTALTFGGGSAGVVDVVVGPGSYSLESGAAISLTGGTYTVDFGTGPFGSFDLTASTQLTIEGAGGVLPAGVATQTPALVLDMAGGSGAVDNTGFTDPADFSFVSSFGAIGLNFGGDAILVSSANGSALAIVGSGDLDVSGQSIGMDSLVSFTAVGDILVSEVAMDAPEGAVTMVAGGSILNGGAVGSITAGALGLVAGDSIILDETILNIGSGTILDFGGDATVIGVLTDAGVEPTSSSPNATLIAGNQIILGPFSMTGDYLYLQADDLEFSDTVTVPTGAAVQLTPFTEGASFGLEDALANLQNVNYGNSTHLSQWAGITVILGNSAHLGDFAAGENGQVDIGDKNLLVATLGNIEGLDSIISTGLVGTLQGGLARIEFFEPTTDEIDPGAGNTLDPDQGELEPDEDEEDEDTGDDAEDGEGEEGSTPGSIRHRTSDDPGLVCE